MTKREWKKLQDQIGERVHTARKGTDLSFQKFADKTGVSKEVLFKIEKGRTLAATRTLAKNAHYLKIEIRELLP